MTRSSVDSRSPLLGAGAWVLAAVLTALVVLYATALTQGACYDSATDPAASYCTSGPAVTVAGVWVLWSLWGLFAAYCAFRVFRAVRR